MKIKITKEHQDEIISLYVKDGMSQAKIAPKYGVCQMTVANILKRNGIKSRERKYPLDEHIFDNFDSEEKLYYLGFFLADGHHNEDTGRLTITLSVVDQEILEKFNEWIYKGQREIRVHHSQKDKKHPNASCTFSINSRIMSNRFAEIGIHGNKTFTAEMPKIEMDEQKFRHFFRGLFDGDGCICLKKDGGSGIDLPGAPTLIAQLAKKMNGYGFSFRIQHFPNRYSKPLSVLRMTGIDNCTRFMEWMYLDAKIFLKRKHAKLERLHVRQKEMLELKSKIKGYRYMLNNKLNPWIASICHKGKQTYLGSFATEEEASKAYQNAKAVLNHSQAQ